jgi:MerR family transcriptional regulator, light-induced transcriptional regulator
MDSTQSGQSECSQSFENNESNALAGSAAVAFDRGLDKWAENADPQAGTNNFESTFNARSKSALLESVAYRLIPQVLVNRANLDVELPRRTQLAPAITPRDLKHLTRLVLTQDTISAQRLIDTLLSRGVSIETIAVDLIGACATAMGPCWEADQLSFIDITLACGELMELCRYLLDLSKHHTSHTMVAMGDHAGSNLPKMLLVGNAGGQHTLGLSIAQVIANRSGFITQAEPSLSESSLLHLASNEWFDVVGLTVGTVELAPNIGRVINQLRKISINKNLVIIAAGNIFARESKLIKVVGADLVGTNAIVLIKEAVAMLGLEPYSK